MAKIAFLILCHRDPDGIAAQAARLTAAGDCVTIHLDAGAGAEAERTLRAKKPQGVVIFDTPGISPFDPGDLAALRSFQEAASAEPVLVLPASGDAAEYHDWADAFAGFGVRRIILTKFDATKRVGAGLSAAHSAGMALAHFSETPFISEGLIDASPEFLARRLLASRPGRITVG